MLKTSAIQDQCIVSLTAEVEKANAAQDHAQAKVEQLKASNQQLLSSTGQDAANAGMVELQRHLDQANQQLACQESAGSTKALVERCESLEKELQLSNQRLQEACAVGGLAQMQARLTSMAGERDAALKRVQEFLAEGQTLTAQHQELKVQLATTTTEYESRLGVANLELESKQTQFEREAKFPQGQKSEVERLIGELKEVRGDLTARKAELDALQTLAPPVHTMAQYPAVPPGNLMVRQCRLTLCPRDIKVRQ